MKEACSDAIADRRLVPSDRRSTRSEIAPAGYDERVGRLTEVSDA
jgi:hypothetical protein